MVSSEQGISFRSALCSVDLALLFGQLQELVSDVHCIIDAMIGKESGISLLCPGTEGVPDVILGDPDRCTFVSECNMGFC